MPKTIFVCGMGMYSAESYAYRLEPLRFVKDRSCGTNLSHAQKKKGLPRGRPFLILVRLAGIEPTTSWFVAFLFNLSHWFLTV